jgi:hypothetical protein
MKTRFDLEQQILNCWNITDDLDLYNERHDSMTEDQRMNYIIGLQELYNQKFERMWSTFEQLVQDKVL